MDPCTDTHAVALRVLPGRAQACAGELTSTWLPGDYAHAHAYLLLPLLLLPLRLALCRLQSGILE